MLIQLVFGENVCAYDLYVCEVRVPDPPEVICS